MPEPIAEPEVRYVALDIHQEYIQVLAIDAHKEVVMHSRRVAMERLSAWAEKALRSTDRVVLEATGNAWDVYDRLSPLVASVTVANPSQVALIARSRVKTDKRDARVLAELLLADMVPAVWVPPDEVRELRSLVAHRGRLVQQRTRLRNRLRAVVLRHNLSAPLGDIFSAANRAWWQELEVSDIEQLRIRHDLEHHAAVSALIQETEAVLTRTSTTAPWADMTPFVLQLPGIAVPSAMVILSAIGDIRRFDTAAKLVGYAGLGASVHSSGKTHHGGPITKQGRRELRTAMVEAAWTAVNTSAYWKAEFANLEDRLGGPKAIVAIARKLLVVVWHVLTEQTGDRHANSQQVAAKLYHWAHRLNRTGRHAQTSPVFVASQLARLRLTTPVTELRQGRRVVRLPQAVPTTPSLPPVRTP